jgi:hypothetical protein
MNEGRPASGCSLPFIAVTAALQTIKRTLSVVGDYLLAAG